MGPGTWAYLAPAMLFIIYSYSWLRYGPLSRWNTWPTGKPLPSMCRATAREPMPASTTSTWTGKELLKATQIWETRVDQCSTSNNTEFIQFATFAFLSGKHHMREGKPRSPKSAGRMGINFYAWCLKIQTDNGWIVKWRCKLVGEGKLSALFCWPGVQLSV